MTWAIAGCVLNTATALAQDPLRLLVPNAPVLLWFAGDSLWTEGRFAARIADTLVVAIDTSTREHAQAPIDTVRTPLSRLDSLQVGKRRVSRVPTMLFGLFAGAVLGARLPRLTDCTNDSCEFHALDSALLGGIVGAIIGAATGVKYIEWITVPIPR